MILMGCLVFVWCLQQTRKPFPCGSTLVVVVDNGYKEHGAFLDCDIRSLMKQDQGTTHLSI